MSREPQERVRKHYSVDPHRLLPQSPDAEKGVLSSMLLGGPTIVEEIASILTPECFFIPGHAAIYKHLVDMQRSGQSVDFITLTNRLRDFSCLDECGGAAFVTELFTFLPTPANWKYYQTILREKYILRRIIELCTEYGGRAYDDQDDETLLDRFQTEVVEIGGLANDAEAMKLVDKAEVMDRIDVIIDRYDNRGKIAGLPTGFVDLDRTLDGLKGKKVYVLAGRPAMGKSAIGVNIVEHICITALQDGGAPCLFFSVEMPREDVVDRLLFARAQISLGRIRDGFMAEADFPRLQKAASEIMNGRLWIDDTPGLTIAQFRSRARKAVIKNKVKLILVDYVQIMRGSSKRSRDNTAEEIKEIMQGIRETAKQLDVPIIVLAQVNRGAEERTDSRPMMADLKESGAIEEEASVVGLLYRPAYYAKTDAKRKKVAEAYNCDVEDIDEIAELNIAKHRNGGTGTIQLKFFGEFTRFEGVTKKLWSNNEEERQR
jgi:replicative DNA helicase